MTYSHTNIGSGQALLAADVVPVIPARDSSFETRSVVSSSGIADASSGGMLPPPSQSHEESPRIRGTHVFSLLGVPSLASTPSTSRVTVASVSFCVCPKSRRSSFQTVTSVAA